MAQAQSRWGGVIHFPAHNRECFSMRGWKIKAWCKKENICPATFYSLQKKGRAPKVTDTGVGGPHITPEDDQQWKKDRAAWAKSDEAKKDAERRIAKAKKAGKMAAKSPLHVSKWGKLELSKLRSRPRQAAE